MTGERYRCNEVASPGSLDQAQGRYRLSDVCGAETGLVRLPRDGVMAQYQWSINGARQRVVSDSSRGLAVNRPRYGARIAAVERVGTNLDRPGR